MKNAYDIAKQFIQEGYIRLIENSDGNWLKPRYGNICDKIIKVPISPPTPHQIHTQMLFVLQLHCPTFLFFIFTRVLIKVFGYPLYMQLPKLSQLNHSHLYFLFWTFFPFQSNLFGSLGNMLYNLFFIQIQLFYFAISKKKKKRVLICKF